MNEEVQALFFSAFLRIKDHEKGGKKAWQSRKHQSRKGKSQRTGDGGEYSALFPVARRCGAASSLFSTEYTEGDSEVIGSGLAVRDVNFEVIGSGLPARDVNFEVRGLSPIFTSK